MNVTCLICGGILEAFHVFPRKALFNKPLSRPVPQATARMGLAYCSHCRHISSARESDYAAGNLEEKIYGELYQGFSLTSLSPSQKRYTDFVADWLASVTPPGSRVLEIGSHDGYFLNRLKERGFDCYGVEPSPFADFAAKQYSLPIKKGFFEADLFEPRSFDLVIVKHVVEHVPEPVKFLRDIGTVLRGGGRLYMEVPNSLVSLEQQYFPEFHIDHISYFTPASVIGILKESGIPEVLHLETTYAYMKFPFISALSRKNNSVPTPVTSYFLDHSIGSLISRFKSRYEKYERNIPVVARTHKLAVWGSGSIATQFAIDGNWAAEDVIVVDINPANHGKFLSVTGHRVMPVETIDGSDCDAVLIASGWEDDVEQQIAAHVRRKVRVLRFADIVGR